MNAKLLGWRTVLTRLFTRLIPAVLIIALISPVLPVGLQEATAAPFDCSTVTDVDESECDALLSLYASTNGDSWTTSTNWFTGTTVDDWYGVNLLSGHVYQLSLGYNNLSGTLPTDIQDLPYLQYLQLNNNSIGGTIPSQLDALTNLKTLNLSHNLLDGTIPSELGSLTNLTHFLLDHNLLDGPLPAALGNMSSLGYLYVNNNELTGSIPPEFANLSSLYTLNLSENQLNGSIPAELGTMTKLEGLYLDENQLTGSIPPELGNISSLYYLNLGENQLDGEIPTELSSLSNLMQLFLDFNQLSGFVPISLGNLPNLDMLYINDNPLSGSFPLSFTANTSMSDVVFRNTGICEPDRPEYDTWKATVGYYSGTDTACVINPLIDETVTSSKIIFGWDPIPDATKYKIELSKKSDFSSLVFSVKSTTNTYDYLTSLQYSKNYYWRVKAKVDGLWSDWTTYWFYSMDPLEAPILDTPADGTISYPDFMLAWNSVPNAVLYKLLVAQDPDFVYKVYKPKISDTFYDFFDIPPGKYYWKVKAIEEGGLKSPWSEVRMITITKVMPPELTFPDDEAIITKNNPTLTWAAADFAVKYKIQVSKDAAFTRLIVNEKTTDLFKDLTDLKNRGYFWRVKAFDVDGNKSPWSEVRSFTVSTP